MYKPIDIRLSAPTKVMIDSFEKAYSQAIHPEVPAAHLDIYRNRLVEILAEMYRRRDDAQRSRRYRVTAGTAAVWMPEQIERVAALQQGAMAAEKAKAARIPVETPAPELRNMDQPWEHLPAAVESAGAVAAVASASVSLAPALTLEPARTEAELERDAAGYANLGVNYFAARDIADRVMDRFSAEMFRPMVDKFTKQFQDDLWAKITDWLIEDTRSNIASEINTRIERTIAALLTGNRHYIDQFVLPAYSSHGEAIRAAIAREIPEELQQRRIKDLEDQVASLTRSLEFRLGVN